MGLNRCPSARWTAAIGLLMLSGCARVLQSGGVTVVRYSWGAVLGLFAIGVVLLVVGAGLMRESTGAAGTAKTSRRKSTTGKDDATKTPGRRLEALVGLLLGAAGILTLALGVPSARDASVTVYPDRVEFRDGLFRWNSEPHTFDFAGLTNIEVEVVERSVSRRDREYLVLSGTMVQDRREMNSLLRTAYPHLVEAWTAFQEKSRQQPGAAPTPGLPSSTIAPLSSASGSFPEEAGVERPEAIPAVPAEPGPR